MMAKHGAAAIKEFTSTAYSQFEMRVVILTGYVNTNGIPSISIWI